MERVVLNALADDRVFAAGDSRREFVYVIAFGEVDPAIFAGPWESERDQVRRRAIARAVPVTLRE